MDTMRLPPDFREFLLLLNSAGIEYLVVGGYAVAFHGYPRPTGDLDIWVPVSDTVGQGMVKVLGKFGFLNADPGLFATPGKVVRMGVPPVRLEILTGISGMTFAECYARRVGAVMDGVEVPMISREDLIRNKEIARRHKDLEDVEQLKARPSGGGVA
jgi:predicted nucleotidyltransferase